jgi:hypothetical protein
MAKQPIILSEEIIPPPALVRTGLETLAPAAAAAGARTSERFIDFFTANIRNRNTRMAYAVAVRQFFNWCEQRSLQVETSPQRPNPADSRGSTTWRDPARP